MQVAGSPGLGAVPVLSGGGQYYLYCVLGSIVKTVEEHGNALVATLASVCIVVGTEWMKVSHGFPCKLSKAEQQASLLLTLWWREK